MESPVTVATTPRAKFPSDLKTLPCTWPGCPKTFNRPARLRDHLNSHTNSRPFKCPYDDCDKDYIEDKHLKQHIKAVHTNERKHVCLRPGCGKSFVTGTRLKRHQAVHEGEDRFRCQDCGQSFRKKETLNKHVRKEHKGLKPHQCTESGCEDAFESKGALKRHLQKVHGEIKFWCGECPLKTNPDGTEHRVGFTTEPLLQAHMKSEHQNCLFCEFKSSSQADMLAHVDMYHSGKTVEDRKTVHCPYDNCTKAFTKKSNLNVHIRTAHEGFRFICGEVELSGPGLEAWSNDHGCGDKFSTKVRLEDHIRYIHLGQERPKVSQPSTAQTDIIDDISGMDILKKQTIQCPHCSDTFIRYFDLNSHLEAVHSPTTSLTDEPAIDDMLQPMSTEAAFPSAYATASVWPENLGDDEIFAAEINYGGTQDDDDWIKDEADIMLLARGSPELDAHIDPALSGL